jgi:branched-chain amino acid transport system permease protein
MAAPSDSPELFSAADTARRPHALAGRNLGLGVVSIVVLLLAPRVFDSNASLSFLSTLGTTMLFCLSYNMLLGEAGMLSFGHAVYPGLGGYFTMHAMLRFGDANFSFPVFLLPLVGGIAGMALGAVFGYVTTKKAGTGLSMITLAIAEMVYAISSMFPRFFGGETGISASRSYGQPWFGWSFGPQLQVYYLIAAWVGVCTVVMYAFTRTPLGQIANAVRENPERCAFVGYDPRRVRYLVFLFSTFFAGVSGALTVINFELVSSENLSILRSADALLFTYIGGIQSFAGPIVGAIVGSLFFLKLSDLTIAWQLYLGIFFVLIVIFAPTGLVGIGKSNWRMFRSGVFGRMLPRWLSVLAAAAVTLVGTVLLVELSYSLTFNEQDAKTLKLIFSLSPAARGALWVLGVACFGGGCAWLRVARRRFGEAWSGIGGQVPPEPPGKER